MFDSFRPIVAPFVCALVLFGLLTGASEARSQSYVDEVAEGMPAGVVSLLAFESVESAWLTFGRLVGEANAISSLRGLLVAAGLDPVDDPVAWLVEKGVDSSAPWGFGWLEDATVLVLHLQPGTAPLTELATIFPEISMPSELAVDGTPVAFGDDVALSYRGGAVLFYDVGDADAEPVSDLTARMAERESTGGEGIPGLSHLTEEEMNARVVWVTATGPELDARVEDGQPVAEAVRNFESGMLGLDATLERIILNLALFSRTPDNPLLEAFRPHPHPVDMGSMPADGVGALVVRLSLHEAFSAVVDALSGWPHLRDALLVAYETTVVPMGLETELLEQILPHGFGGWLHEWPDMTVADPLFDAIVYAEAPEGTGGFLYQNIYESYVADGSVVAARVAGAQTVHTFSGVYEQEYATSRNGDLIWFATLGDMLKDLLEGDSASSLFERNELAARYLGPEVSIGAWADAQDFRSHGQSAASRRVSDGRFGFRVVVEDQVATMRAEVYGVSEALQSRVAAHFTRTLSNDRRDAVIANLAEINARTLEFWEASRESGEPRFPSPSPATPSLEAHSDGCVDGATVEWGAQTWIDLDFSVEDPRTYMYQYDSSGVGNTAQFTASAFGDLDCDGVYSTFVRFGTVNELEVRSSDGYYIAHELE